jgi:hypothetical protein
VITIDNLDVSFDAERQDDEAVFAQLFARHIARWEERRRGEAEGEARANRERSIHDSRGRW